MQEQENYGSLIGKPDAAYYGIQEQQADGGQATMPRQVEPAVYPGPTICTGPAIYALNPQPLYESQPPAVVPVAQEYDYIEGDSCLPCCVCLVGCWTALLLSPWCLFI